MPRRGKRAAASKKNGALAGRSSGSAEGHPPADAPQGAAALVAPSKKKAGRPRNKPSAEPLVRRDPDRICVDDGRAFLTDDSPHDRPPVPRNFLELEGRKSRAGEKRKQLDGPGQNKQGRGTQRGSRLSTQFIQKKKQGRDQQQLQQENEEGKAAAAAKAASDTRTGIFGKQEQQYSSSSKWSNGSKCSSNSSKCSSSSSSKYKAAMQQQQR